MEGWVKNHRKIEEWEWYKDVNTAHLFQHLIRRANHKPGNWKGTPVPVGCLITSIRSLSDQTGLSEMQVRTALKHLKSTHDITQTSTRKYTLLKVENYEFYQSDNAEDNTVITHKQHTDNTVITTNKNEKNNKNERMKEKTYKTKGSFDPMSCVCERYENPEIREAFKNFFEVRKKQKKPVETERTLNTLINKLESLAFSDDERIEVIDQSAERGWLSFFELKQKPASYSKVPDEILAWGDKGNV